MKNLFLWACAFITSIALGAPVPLVPAVPEKQEKFIGVDMVAGKITALKTATSSYTKDGVTVDLIGVVHIGDSSYYKTLNRNFTGYEALLYEMVGPPDARPRRGDVDLLGLIVKFTLELESQKALINYNKANFVHADLSFKGIQDAMKRRGETLTTLGLRVIADLIKEQILNDGKQAEAFVGGDTLTIKRSFAKQLSGKTHILPAIEEILIRDRNKAAMEVLDKELKKGKKKVALFYGAAHLPDFEERLLKLGFKHKGTSWLVAWDLSDD